MLNPYFTQGTRSEQNLVQDLINEQLRMYGVDIYYIPRKYMTEKTVIREVVQSKFDNALPIEAYVDNYDAYAGAGDVLSKFGIESKDEVRLIISRERYENYITPLIQGQANIKLSTRPKGGDLIWFPLDDRLYEIKDIEYAKPYINFKISMSMSCIVNSSAIRMKLFLLELMILITNFLVMRLMD